MDGTKDLWILPSQDSLCRRHTCRKLIAVLELDRKLKMIDYNFVVAASRFHSNLVFINLLLALLFLASLNFTNNENHVQFTVTHSCKHIMDYFVEMLTYGTWRSLRDLRKSHRWNSRRRHLRRSDRRVGICSWRKWDLVLARKFLHINSAKSRGNPRGVLVKSRNLAN